MEKKFYVLTFHKKDRDVITTKYLEYVALEGKAIALRNRKRKLYTNKNSNDWLWEGSKWSDIEFEHLASLNTIAVDPAKTGDHR